jgi:thymidylate kinase
MSSIVILEGANGGGKSSYAKMLSERLKLPVYRAFRGDTGAHWGEGGGREELLKEKFKVPLNTHVDDLYIADLLSALDAGVILDRSMPSAIAYGQLYSQPVASDPKVAREMLHFWQATLAKGKSKVLYIWLRSTYEQAKKRCEGRWWPLNKEQFTQLDKTFTKVFQDLKLARQQINTNTVEIADGVELVCSLIKR